MKTYSYVQYTHTLHSVQVTLPPDADRHRSTISYRGRGCRLRWALAFGSAVQMAISSLVTAQGTLQSRTPPSTDTLRLTLAQARARAVRANPDLQTARLDVEIARGDLRQSRLLVRSNPEADLLTRGAGTELGVTQEFEVAGQRGARRRAALAGVDRATASVTNVARLTIGDVDRAFYRVAAATRRAALAREVLDLTQRLTEMSRRKLDVGDISALEYNLAAVELGRAQARAIATAREREEVASELRRLLGFRPMAPIDAVVDGAPTMALDADSLSALALARRPDLAEQSAAVRAADAQASVARREAFPNVLLRVSSEVVETSGARELRPGLGFTLPVFNRNRGEVQAREAAALQAARAHTGLTARIRVEVSRAVASYREAVAETDVLRTTVLAPARDNRALLETAFREGKVGLPVLLLIRNQTNDAELEYWAAWLAEHLALVDLTEATGEAVVGFDPGSVP
ncbi:MAG: TolC family protein [Gemmatimonadaceae bacterium]